MAVYASHNLLDIIVEEATLLDFSNSPNYIEDFDLIPTRLSQGVFNLRLTHTHRQFNGEREVVKIKVSAIFDVTVTPLSEDALNPEFCALLFMDIVNYTQFVLGTESKKKVQKFMKMPVVDVKIAIPKMAQILNSFHQTL